MLNSLKRSLGTICLSFCCVLSSNICQAASWSDSGAYDVGWYSKNQTEFNISTPAQLAGLAYLVNNNFTSFDNVTIRIDKDINLSGRDWIPIGIGNTIFKGIIDGNDNRIYNIDIQSGGSGGYAGFFTQLKNGSVFNIKFDGKIVKDYSYLGLIAGEATNVTFENVSVNTSIIYSSRNIKYGSTGNTYSMKIGGLVGNSLNCKYIDVDASCGISYIFGATGGSCFGGVEVDAGGLVGYCENDNFERCHVKNTATFEVNGYVASSYHTPKSSVITYGGICGRCYGSGSKIIACLAENSLFNGSYNTGTYNSLHYRFGGIVGYMSNLRGQVLKSSVAVNSNYIIKGHDYSWVASWYHTSSSFGGIGYSVPSEFGGCYSNNDVAKSISKVEGNDILENGSSAYSKSQMNTQDFVNEANLYSQIEFDENFWTLDEKGKLAILKTKSSGIDEVMVDEDDETGVEIFNLNGQKVGNNINAVSQGIYIVKKGRCVKKIAVK